MGTELDPDARAMITGLDAIVALGAQRRIPGTIPGMVEEILVAMRAKKPIFIAGLLGGAAGDIGRPARREGDPPTLGAESRKPNPAGWVPTSSVGNSSSSTIPRSVETARPTAMRTGSTTSGSSRRYAMRGCRP